MSNPFVAEIRIFAGNFAPTGWAQCNGQLMALSQNTALFSLLGTTYGGDGRSTFALPNLQGAAPLQQGQGPGLSLRDLGETGGEQFVTLIQTEMPSHPHTLQVDDSASTGTTPGPAMALAGGNTKNVLGVPKPVPPRFHASDANNKAMNPISTSIAGGNLPHNNMPPYLVLTFIIALQGVYPARG